MTALAVSSSLVTTFLPSRIRSILTALLRWLPRSSPSILLRIVSISFMIPYWKRSNPSSVVCLGALTNLSLQIAKFCSGDKDKFTKLG
jgi:hypothetical protein